MSSAGLFPDIADVTVQIVAQLVGDARAGVMTPPDLAQQLPYVRVSMVGGNDDLMTDHAAVDVDVFAADIPTSNLLGEQVRRLLLGNPVGMGHVVGAAVVDSYRTITRPRQIPYPTTGVWRNGATYKTQARRSRTA